MGSGVQNVSFFRFFIMLGTGVVLTLFIYASYNSNGSGLPPFRTGTPLLHSPVQPFRNQSIFKEARETLFSENIKFSNVKKRKDLNNIVKNDIKNSILIKHHRQPTIDVEPPGELESEVDERLLKDQLFAGSNFSSNSSLAQQQAQLQEQGEYIKNKIFDDLFIPTSTLQKFMEDAETLIKNITGVKTNLQSADKDLKEITKKNSQKLLHSNKSSLSTSHDPSMNKTMTTETRGSFVILDPAQGILTTQIYESGHRGGEVNIEKICPDAGNELKLLIMITSAQSHQEARLAIRQTWGHYGTRRDTAIVFILGRSSNETLHSLLTQENLIYGDLIRGNFLDTYNNLTLKTISALEWVDRHCAKAKHILKTDDDMFINIPKLLTFLEKHTQEKRIIYGRLAKKWKPIRNKKSKYYVSPGQFSATIFPTFTTGPAYMMSSDIVHDLYQRALQQTYLKLEDVFTTGIVAQQLGVKRVHVNEFLNRRIAFNPCNIRKTISVHMIKANEQIDLWKKLLDKSTKCK